MQTIQRISAEAIENVFPEARRRLVAVAIEQKRRAQSWLIVFDLLALLVIVANFADIVIFVGLNRVLVTDCILFAWIIAVVLTPFVWPQKPGDFFSEDLKGGLNPRVWDYEGNWRVEIDASGKPILRVTGSEKGGIVNSCLSWIDYELQFQTRIVDQCSAWIIRASNLNNYAMFQLRTDLIRPHKRSVGGWIWADDIKHNLPINVGEWYPVTTIVRGAWVTIFITVNGIEHQVYQERILGTQQPVAITIQQSPSQPPSSPPATAIIEPSFRYGSFGFRLDGSETADFRAIRAYRLR